MNAAKVSYVFDSVLPSVDKAEQLVLESATGAGFDEEVCGRIGIAVREAMANAILHGNRSDPAKRVTLSLERTSERLTIAVRDEGAGMDHASVANPLDPANLMKGSGRGIFLIRAFMDEVEFPDVSPGTEICMTKFLSAPGHGDRKPMQQGSDPLGS